MKNTTLNINDACWIFAIRGYVAKNDEELLRANRPMKRMPVLLWSFSGMGEGTKIHLSGRASMIMNTPIRILNTATGSNSAGFTKKS